MEINQIVHNLNTKLKYTKTEAELKEMLEFFLKAAPKSFVYTHYELEKISGIESNKGQEFIQLTEIKEHVEEQLFMIQENNSRKAQLELGSASSSIDIQKAREYQRVAEKNGKTKSFKPFTIMFLPKETLKYKRALLEIKQLCYDNTLTPDNVLETIFKVIPPKKDEVDAFKARTRTT